MKEYKFITKILNTRFLKEDAHGAMHMPVYENVAFEFKNAEDLELAFQGKKPAHMYSRISNPTVENFEQRIRSVTDATGVIALSSGMAAISNLFLAIAGRGDNIITSKHLFGNTYSLFERTLKQWGLEVRYADLKDAAQVTKLIDAKTVAVYLETITNPQLEVVDIKALADKLKPKGVLLIADTTLTPPYIFKAKDFGVDIEVLSSTKYISGGATSVGGLIIDYGSFDWSKNNYLKSQAKKYGPFTLLQHLRREAYRNLGACMSAQAAFLQSIGLETLPLRVDVSCSNALKIAKFLSGLKTVKGVNYPGLETSPDYSLAKKQFGNNPGSILTFDLESKEAAFKFMNKLQLIRRSTNLNDNRTLIIHPASTIFCEYDAATLKQMGVRDTMLRLAVGIEDVEDLVEDINRSL